MFIDYPSDGVTDAARRIQPLRGTLQKVMFGKEELIELAICGAQASGHILLEGRLGLGKTEIVKGLAKALELETHSVQSGFSAWRHYGQSHALGKTRRRTTVRLSAQPRLYQSRARG